jgi:hypothetical protein
MDTQTLLIVRCGRWLLAPSVAPGTMMRGTQPRAMTVTDVTRQARGELDDLRLYALHPQLTTKRRLPLKARLVVGAGLRWLQRIAIGAKPAPRRFLRCLRSE